MERLKRASAAACGVEPAALRELYLALGEKQVHSMMITRHNQVIAEGWWTPYKPEYAHIQYSVSKSFVGTAIGIAVTQGLLTVDDTILSILGDRLPSAPCENMQKLTVRNVLTMSTGHKDERNMFQPGESWCYSLLTSYLDHTPGQEFRYISSSTYLLCAVIRKLTGKNVFDYLKENLFDPMGFSDAIWWENSPEGINTGFNGFNATAEDITKLGLLYLNRGVWNGKRILSEQWVDEAMSVQIDNADNRKNQKLGDRQGFGILTEDWCSGYGYLFWHCRPARAVRADGIYGQMCIILPEQDMTVSIAAGYREPGEILDILWDKLLPAVDPAQLDSSKETELEQTLAGLQIPVVEGAAHSELEAGASGKTFALADTGSGIRTLRFCFGAEEPVVEITTQKGTLRLPVGYGQWITSETGYDPDGFSCDNVIFFGSAAACGAWQKDEYVLRLVYTRTPFVDTLRVRFEGNVLRGTYSHAVKYGRQGYELLGTAL